MSQTNTGCRYVTPGELVVCRQDPAWEARQGIVDRVICRVCAARIQTRLAGRHLRRHQMSISEYRATYPGARLYSFTCSAERHGDDPQKLMARFLAKYVTPEELVECRENRHWERDHKVAFVVCRGCGAKLSAHLTEEHLQREDGISASEYLARYPGARLTSLAHYTNTRAWVKKNLEKENAYQRTYRKAHPEKINAIQRRHYHNRSPEKVQKDSERNRAKYQRLRGDAKKIQRLRSLTGHWKEQKQKIGFVLVLRPSSSNAEAQGLAGAKIPIKEMTRLRDLLGIHGQKGWKKGKTPEGLRRTASGHFDRQ